MARSKLINTVEDSSAVAARKASEAFIEAAERLAPLIDQAGEHLGPLTGQARKISTQVASGAYGRVRPALRDVGIRGARIASDAYSRVQPAIDDALQAVPPVVDHAVGVVRPAIDTTLERIPPIVEVARGKVQDEVMPKVASALKDAASQPLAAEAAAQLALAAAATAKEAHDAGRKPKKRSPLRVFGKIVLAGALLAGVATVVRKLLTPPTTGWHAHAPSDAYVADPVADVIDDIEEHADDLAYPAETAATHFAETATQEATDAGDTVENPAEVQAETVPDQANAAAGEAAEPAVADETAEGDDASPLAGNSFGEGSFVGAEAPEGFDIKANARTKKFRTPQSSGYERATADVWFDTVEHAEAAGFSQAQR